MQEINLSENQVRGLVELTSLLPRQVREQALREVIAAGRDISNAYTRAYTLSGLILELSESQKDRIVQEAIAEVRGIYEARDRIR